MVTDSKKGRVGERVFRKHLVFSMKLSLWRLHGGDFQSAAVDQVEAGCRHVLAAAEVVGAERQFRDVDPHGDPLPPSAVPEDRGRAGRVGPHLARAGV